MDANWFKRRKKSLGVTDADIANVIGRDRSAVPKILAGQQKMTFEWADAFAKALNVPAAEILEKSGDFTPEFAASFKPGFAESDVLHWTPAPDQRQVPLIGDALGARPGVDIWRIKSTALVLAGYLPGDFILVDTYAAERVKSGDIVVAQVYTRDGAAKTVLRKWMPPALIPAAAPGDIEQVYLVDNDNVSIRGKVTACWRVT